MDWRNEEERGIVEMKRKENWRDEEDIEIVEMKRRKGLKRRKRERERYWRDGGERD